MIPADPTERRDTHDEGYRQLGRRHGRVDMSLTPGAALLVANALHLGFQGVVTSVVYPALREVPAPEWGRAHAAHCRRIIWSVVPVYGLLAAACAWALLAGPRGVLSALAVAGASTAGLATAVVAGPTHRRLAREGPTGTLLTRLRRADLVRLAGAIVGFCSALAVTVS